MIAKSWAALGDIFRKQRADKLGKHNLETSGIGHERDYDTKAYEYGDPFNLDINRTVRNAVTRSGGGTPVRLDPDDFEIERTEQSVRSSCSTSRCRCPCATTSCRPRRWRWR